MAYTGRTLVASDGYEVAVYPLESIRITQTCHGSTSHSSYKMANTGLWDVTGVSGDSPLGCIYAPFTGVVKAIMKGKANGNQTMIQSKNKVHLANGKLDYACFGFGHDNVLDIKVGQEVKQGQFIGNCGDYGNVYGTHSHFLIGEGKWTKGRNIPLTTNKNGAKMFYCPNAINIDEMFFTNGVRVINVSKLEETNDPYKFNWKEFIEMDLSILKSYRDTSRHQIEVTVDNMNARKTPTLSGEKLGFLPEGIFNVFETKDSDNYTWVRIGYDVWMAKVKDCFTEYPATDDYKEKVEKIKEILS